jgi:hypothetical protein
MGLEMGQPRQAFCGVQISRHWLDERSRAQSLERTAKGISTRSAAGLRAICNPEDANAMVRLSSGAGRSSSTSERGDIPTQPALEEVSRNGKLNDELRQGTNNMKNLLAVAPMALTAMLVYPQMTP